MDTPLVDILKDISLIGIWILVGLTVWGCIIAICVSSYHMLLTVIRDGWRAVWKRIKERANDREN